MATAPTNSASKASSTQQRPSPVNDAASELIAQITTPVRELSEVFAAQSEAIARDGAPTLEERRRHLRTLEQVVMRNRLALATAAVEDFGTKSSVETEISEIVGTVSTIRYMRHNLRRWMKPRRRSTSIWFAPGKGRVLAQPKGVVGVISPWNFPVHLSIVPMATALAAGNRVMVKMSEYTPSTTRLLMRVLREEFDRDTLHISSGGPDVGGAFAQLPFGHLFFTGSTGVGKSVAAAAAKNLTPVTLELGGKSPVIVDRHFPAEAAARSIVWGKLYNGGQVCIAPDYVLVPEGHEHEFADAATRVARELYPDIEGNPDYTSAIHDAHYARLVGLIEDAQTRGAKIVSAGGPDEGVAERKVPLSVIVNPESDARVMGEEIFGPVLPVIGYGDLDDAIRYVNGRPRPLALYLFTNEEAHRDAVLSRTTSGGVTVNDTMVHYLVNDLPFGGVGASGMGSYHGREGFDTFSHLKPVFFQRPVAGRTGVQMLYPPYQPVAKLILRMMRWI